MKNSSSVFGNYNQFSQSTADIVVTKPHYYPSNNKELDENSKKIGLTQKYIDAPMHDDSTFFGEVKEMPGHAPEYISYIDSSASSKYNESWPITDENISLQNHEISPKDTMKGSNKEHSIEDYLEKNGENKENKGTLSRYVQRFREHPPLSRVERVSRKGDKNAEFWWLTSPTHPKSSTPYSSDSSTPLEPNSLSFSPALTDQDTIISSAADKQRMPQPRLLYGSDSDSGVARMQLRTEKLLQLSENAVKDSSLSTSLKSQNPYTKKCKDILSSTEERRKSPKLSPVSSNESDENSVFLSKVSEPLKPEDDILYKWRLMRKMELAAKSTSSNAFLKITDAKKDTDSVKKNFGEPISVVDKIEDKLLKVTTKENNNSDEIVVNATTIENESAQSKAAIDTKNVLDGDKGLNVCCKKTCQNCVQHSNCEDSHLRCASIKRGRRENMHCKRESCGCCDILDHDEVSCSGHRLPQNTKCNPFVYHIPSLVHIYDTMPCHHKGQANIPGHQCDSVLVKKKDKLCIGEFKENLDQIEEKSPCKNTVSPVIKQVISDHLFIDSNETIEMASKHTEVTKEKRSRKTQSEDDSSSGDEYPDDEILQELRSRRRNNKNEWRMISEQLRLKQMGDLDSKS